MKEWQRKVSEALNEFSGAKAKEDEVFSILNAIGSNTDYRRVEVAKQWRQLRQATQEKNDIVVFLLRNAPESSISISSLVAQDVIVH